MDTIYIIPKLAYEILNVPLANIAASIGLSTSMLENIAEEQEWQQWFPNDSEDSFTIEERETIEGEDTFILKADQFLDKSKKKLQVFNMAKQLAFAEHYADLELSLIQKTKEKLAGDDLPVTALHSISNIFRDLTKNILNGTNAISMAKDEDGLPTVILRDLSGTDA